MEAVRPIRPRRTETRTARSAAVPIPTCSSTTASTTASPSTRKPVRSKPTGTLPCARATSAGWRLAAPVAAVSAAVVVPLRVEAALLVPPEPPVLVPLRQAPQLPVLPPRVLALRLDALALLVLVPRVPVLRVLAGLRVLAVEAAVPPHLHSRRLFSAARARSSP